MYNAANLYFIFNTINFDDDIIYNAKRYKASREHTFIANFIVRAITLRFIGFMARELGIIYFFPPSLLNRRARLLHNLLVANL